jgi:hypothetical protein
MSKRYTDQEISDFTIVHHIHIGEELTISVNPYGQLWIGTVGGEIEPEKGRYPLPVVYTDTKINHLTSSDYRNLAAFFNKAADALDKL